MVRVQLTIFTFPDYLLFHSTHRHSVSYSPPTSILRCSACTKSRPCSYTLFGATPLKPSQIIQMLIPPHFSPLLFSSLLLLSVPALLFFFPNFIHEAFPLKNPGPNSVVDHLFHRNVLSRPSMSSPLQTRQPKIAFLFLTNTDLSFIPLWERFFQNNTNLFNIYIHLDPSAQVEKPLTGLFANRFVSAKPTQRASASLIAATKRLLAAALIDDSANEYFALLSQSCVPIRSFNFVYRSLVSDPQKRSFIEILSDEPQLQER